MPYRSRMGDAPARRAAIARVIAAYDDPIVRAYSWGRFLILRQRFLDEIGQYLPADDRILDLGCGFGLFSLYYATAMPGATLHGVDLSARRIRMAAAAATRLAVTNASYEVGDVRGFRAGTRYAAAYMLDIVHHIAPATVPPLITELHRTLAPGGCLVVKDVDTTPAYKRLFTHALDLVMSPRATVHYWAADELQAVLEGAGFRVYRHAMVDVLPYPHVLYVCRKT